MVVQITQSKRAHLTSHSEIPGFNVFSSPIQNINTLQEQMLCCISHLTANIFNFSWNVELGIFITSVTRTKQMWRLWSSNSWQVLSVHLHSGLNQRTQPSSQVQYGPKHPGLGVCYKKPVLGISISSSFVFLPVSSMEHGLPSPSPRATSIWSLGTDMIQIKSPFTICCNFNTAVLFHSKNIWQFCF